MQLRILRKPVISSYAVERGFHRCRLHPVEYCVSCSHKGGCVYVYVYVMKQLRGCLVLHKIRMLPAWVLRSFCTKNSIIDIIKKRTERFLGFGSSDSWPWHVSWKTICKSVHTYKKVGQQPVLRRITSVTHHSIRGTERCWDVNIFISL